MAYHVTLEYSNGYRCSCCQRSWESSEWYDTLEEALKQVPTELVDGEPHPFNGDLEISKVEVKDGETGEDVAWANALWSRGFGRYSGYSYTRWSGWRDDLEGGTFEVVYSGRKKLDKTWDEVTAELKEKQRQEELAKAQKDLADSQKRLDLYS